MPEPQPQQTEVMPAASESETPEAPAMPDNFEGLKAEYEKLKTLRESDVIEKQKVLKKNEELIGKLKTSKELEDKAKAAGAAERAEAQTAMEANNEHKGLADSLKIDLGEKDQTIADLRKELAESQGTQSKFDEINERAKKSVDLKIKDLSKDHQTKLKRFYPDWDNLSAVDQLDRLTTYSTEFMGNVNGSSAPSGTGQASTNIDMLTLENEVAKGGPAGEVAKAKLRQWRFEQMAEFDKQEGLILGKR